MKVNIISDRSIIRLNNMKPGLLFSLKDTLYIRTDSTTEKYVKCVNVISGTLQPLDKDAICWVRDDLHITNIEAKDED